MSLRRHFFPPAWTVAGTFLLLLVVLTGTAQAAWIALADAAASKDECSLLLRSGFDNTKGKAYAAGEVSFESEWKAVDAGCIVPGPMFAELTVIDEEERRFTNLRIQVQPAPICGPLMITESKAVAQGDVYAKAVAVSDRHSDMKMSVGDFSASLKTPTRALAQDDGGCKNPLAFYLEWRDGFSGTLATPAGVQQQHAYVHRLPDGNFDVLNMILGLDANGNPSWGGSFVFAPFAVAANDTFSLKSLMPVPGTRNDESWYNGRWRRPLAYIPGLVMSHSRGFGTFPFGDRASDHPSHLFGEGVVVRNAPFFGPGLSEQQQKGNIQHFTELEVER